MNRRGFLAAVAVASAIAMPMPWLRRTLEVVRGRVPYIMMLEMSPPAHALIPGDTVQIGELSAQVIDVSYTADIGDFTKVTITMMADDGMEERYDPLTIASALYNREAIDARQGMLFSFIGYEGRASYDYVCGGES